jgi:hypothetical protein
MGNRSTPPRPPAPSIGSADEYLRFARSPLSTTETPREESVSSVISSQDEILGLTSVTQTNWAQNIMQGSASYNVESSFSAIWKIGKYEDGSNRVAVMHINKTIFWNLFCPETTTPEFKSWYNYFIAMDGDSQRLQQCTFCSTAGLFAFVKSKIRFGSHKTASLAEIIVLNFTTGSVRATISIPYSYLGPVDFRAALLALSPDGTLVAFYPFRKTDIRVFEISSGEPVIDCPVGLPSGMRAMAFPYDNQQLAVLHEGHIDPSSACHLKLFSWNIADISNRGPGPVLYSRDGRGKSKVRYEIGFISALNSSWRLMNSSWRSMMGLGRHVLEDVRFIAFLPDSSFVIGCSPTTYKMSVEDSARAVLNRVQDFTAERLENQGDEMSLQETLPIPGSMFENYTPHYKAIRIQALTPRVENTHEHPQVRSQPQRRRPRPECTLM